MTSLATLPPFFVPPLGSSAVTGSWKLSLLHTAREKAVLREDGDCVDEQHADVEQAPEKQHFRVERGRAA